MLSLLQLIDTVINLYIWALLIFIVLSWLVQFKVINSNNRAVYLVMDFLYRITEPVLRPIRNLLPNLGGLDISPIVLVLALTFGRNLLFEFSPVGPRPPRPPGASRWPPIAPKSLTARPSPAA